jgi:hypothetical protein
VSNQNFSLDLFPAFPQGSDLLASERRNHAKLGENTIVSQTIARQHLSLRATFHGARTE